MSEKGELCPAKAKSGVIDFVLKTGHANSSETPCVDFKIFDGPALVNMLSPTNCKTLLDYANNVFLPYIETHRKTVNRVDLVWDRYFDKSLKGRTRSNRRVGV